MTFQPVLSTGKESINGLTALDRPDGKAIRIADRHVADEGLPCHECINAALEKRRHEVCGLHIDDAHILATNSVQSEKAPKIELRDRVAG